MKLTSDHPQFQNNRFAGSPITRNYKGNVRDLRETYTTAEVQVMTAMEFVFDSMEVLSAGGNIYSYELQVQCANKAEYDFAWRVLSELKRLYSDKVSTRIDFSNNSKPCLPGDYIRSWHTERDQYAGIVIQWMVPETAGKELAAAAYA